MVINRAIIMDVYKSVLDGSCSFDEADRWAYGMMTLCDNRELTFEPQKDEKLLWDLITYLYGIDVPSMSDRTKPARSKSDIRDFLVKKGLL